MREIKYRLLDKDRNIIQIYTLNELISKTFRKGKFEYRGCFTGLKDKNGKEIYEGDKVQWNSKKHFDPYGSLMNKKRIEKVYYNEFGFEPFISSDGYNGVEMINYEDCEVIGNIYENSELLEDQ